MARKNVLEYQLATAQSLAASFISPVTVTKYLDNCSYQIDVTTSDSNGSFTVEVSDNYAINEETNSVTSAGTWGTLPIGGTPVAGGANDVIQIDINQLSFKAMRIRYVSSVAGTGTCAIKLVCRQLGG